MTEDSKKIVLPAFLNRRFEAFRIVRGTEQSYVVRDKLHGKTYDFDAWQFFILEVLPGCESVEKLQTVFKDRFDRDITKKEIDDFLGSLADAKLLDETAAQHPLLARFTKITYVVSDEGKATPKPFSDRPATSQAATPAPAEEPSANNKQGEDVAGGEPPLGLDWPDPKVK